jgi:hypothetical protein
MQDHVLELAVMIFNPCMQGGIPQSRLDLHDSKIFKKGELLTTLTNHCALCTYQIITL